MLPKMRDKVRNIAASGGASSDGADLAGERGRVVQLFPRRPPTDDRQWPPRSPVEDIGKYERADHDDDYRHRMIMNGLALVACILLAIGGIWLATTIAEIRKNQDCVLSGRRDCAPLDAPTRLRW